MTVIGLTGLAAVGWFVMSVIGDLIQSIIFARPLTASITGEQAGQVATLTGLGFLRLIQFTMLVAAGGGPDPVPAGRPVRAFGGHWLRPDSA